MEFVETRTVGVRPTRSRDGVRAIYELYFCAFFLLSGMDEESAFWCLDGLVNRIVPGYFTEGMAKAMEDQRVFSRVVNKIEPELGVHLDALGADNIVSAITSSQWLLTLFVNVLPTRCTFRVWDRVIESGHRAVVRGELRIVRRYDAKRGCWKRRKWVRR